MKPLNPWSQNSSRRTAYLSKREHDAQGNIYENIKDIKIKTQFFVMYEETICVASYRTVITSQYKVSIRKL